ncbi:phosphinothricin acetyltransferase [Bryocella elongata]|uniref:Phosphinothricin acetyltransferase n=1 Tax=Bryocella elongata TaxID=863522 RepID=A0A1H5ZQ96_9BACT|nr:GNAT family N-acetyltransferase [Bryocella elongata]SEG38174.1 phosphinothricin acetyltransferase [Bryocella elongata]
MTLRDAVPLDAASIVAIYNHYVTTTSVSFEEAEVAAAEMAARIEAIQASGLPWYVATDGDRTLGYAYASRWRSRSAYRYAAEVTVYVAAGQGAKGAGSALYRLLLPTLRERGFHTALATIALPNPASIAFHERFGFRKAGHVSQVGFKENRWVDVGYWQLMLQSPVPEAASGGR